MTTREKRSKNLKRGENPHLREKVLNELP